MEEVDNPPASSCRAPLPAGIEQTPGMTELGRKRAANDGWIKYNMFSKRQEAQLAISHFSIVSWSASVRFVSYQYSFHHQSGSLRWCRTGMYWESARTSELPRNNLEIKHTITLICLTRVPKSRLQLYTCVTFQLAAKSFKDKFLLHLAGKSNSTSKKYLSTMKQWFSKTLFTALDCIPVFL